MNLGKSSLAMKGITKRDFSKIAEIIRKEHFDIVAFQEILSEGQALDYLVKYYLPGWEIFWKAPKESSDPLKSGDLRGEGYAFLWNTKRLRLATSIVENGERVFEPRIVDEELHLDCSMLARCPLYARLIPVHGGFFEFRLINIHMHFGNNSKTEIERRKEEYNFLLEKIYPAISMERRYGNNREAYIDLLDVSIPEDKEKIHELVEFAEEMSGGANDVLQLCAFSYFKIGRLDKAAVLLRRLVNEGYNRVVNAQLLSGYYVFSYISGDAKAARDYKYLQERINEKYLFPLLRCDMLEKLGGDAEQYIQSNFLQNQKEILTEKFGLVIDLFRRKYLFAFNRCIPVPADKMYTDEYYDGSVNSFSARKMDGMVLKKKRGLLNYVSKLQECDYPYNYLLVLNDMLNTIFTLDCVQGGENKLLKCLSDAILSKRDILKTFREKIEDESKFTAETYNEMIEFSFEELTNDFFENLLTYSSAYIAMKRDIISMNNAEKNLRDFCIQQGFDTPEALFENADNVKEVLEIRKQFLGIELIDDGVLTSEVNEHFQEIQNKISLYTNELCVNNDNCKCILSGEEEFDKYFIRLGTLNKREIRRKTVAIIDDTTTKDNDLLLTTEGIIQIVRGKMKENVPYDDIKINIEKNSIVLRQPYCNQNIYMDKLIKVIMTLRSKSYMEVKEKKGAIEIKKALNDKLKALNIL